MNVLVFNLLTVVVCCGVFYRDSFLSVGIIWFLVVVLVNLNWLWSVGSLIIIVVYIDAE